QRHILRRLLSQSSLSDSCMGFTAGRSIRSNAERHCHRRFVFNIDLKDFFPSITSDRVLNTFLQLGCSEEVSRTLVMLTTYRGSLPQGAPTSPYLANLIARPLDARLEAFATSRNWHYTRYCDDITFSGDDRFTFAAQLKIKKLVELEDFSLNDRKTRLSGRNRAQIVTGLVVNDGANVPRKQRRQVRAMFHNAKKHAESFDDKRRFLEGHLSYLNMISPGSKTVERMKTTFNELAQLERA
ncbi:MAG: reverse transcriptase family protein, partial [Cyanobacteria bacterium]|nr:reverse transcriptase family protein [Cyanobacteriota bacterium]